MKDSKEQREQAAHEQIQRSINKVACRDKIITHNLMKPYFKMVGGGGFIFLWGDFDFSGFIDLVFDTF